MIIKMTVKNNDFTDIIEAFADKFYGFGFSNMATDVNTSQEEIAELSKMDTEYIMLMKPRNSRLSRKEKRLLISYIKKLFNHYIRNNEARDYLTKNFKVSIIYIYKDKYEHDENVYFFSSNGRHLTQ